MIEKKGRPVLAEFRAGQLLYKRLWRTDQSETSYTPALGGNVLDLTTLGEVIDKPDVVENSDRIMGKKNYPKVIKRTQWHSNIRHINYLHNYALKQLFHKMR